MISSDACSIQDVQEQSLFFGRAVRPDRMKLGFHGIPWDATGLRICASWPSKNEQFEQSVDSPRNPRESQYALRAESFELLPGSLENLDESCPPFEGRKFLKK